MCPRGPLLLSLSLHISCSSHFDQLAQKMRKVGLPDIILSLSFIILYHSLNTMTEANAAEKFNRLPELARPSLYEMRLSVALEGQFAFRGNQKIHLDVLWPTRMLQLHAKGLDVRNGTLTLESGKILSNLELTLDDKSSLLTVRLPFEIGPQKAVLGLEFGAQIGTNMQGFYRSSYTDAEGQEQHIASTYFEPTYARRAFPCWDEPIYKAQFDIRLEVDSRLVALSNMNAEEERSTGNGTKLVRFARTPLMSSYLVAYVVGKLEYIEGMAKDNHPVRVYTASGRSGHSKYALEVAVRAIDWYTEWFGIRMPLPKSDLIGVPNFPIGGMENWGLITFREVHLQYDPAHSSHAQKEQVTLIIGHEVAHFWFGDLVTMKWWTDLWLKEGFASFMEYLFVSYNYPQMKIWLSFMSEITSGMQLDALRNSHPIEVPIENPNELVEIFDAISYSKGCSVIRMLFSHLGEPTFRKGIHAYLDAHKFGNAETEDLWKALSQASGTDVSALMSSWTQQMGFPLVSVEQRQVDGNRHLGVHQTRFLAEGGQTEGRPVWQVPISVTSQSHKAKFLLTKEADTFVVDGVKPGEWVKLNSEFASFFRVQYSAEMLQQILAGVKSGQMATLDRYQIASDLFALVQSGRIDVAQFLRFLSSNAPTEPELAIWESLDASMAAIDNVLAQAEDDGGDLQKQFHHFTSAILAPVAAKYGWEPRSEEDFTVGQLRALLLKRLVRSGHEPTFRQALALFDEHVAKGANLVPDLRAVIFSAAARTNDANRIKQLQKMLSHSYTAEVQKNAFMALAQCSEPALMEQVFQKAIVEKGVRSQDAVFLFVGASQSGQGASVRHAWDFFKRNVALLLQMYDSPDSKLFQNCLKSAAREFSSRAMAEEVKKFCEANFDAVGQATLDRPIRQIVESILLNERLLEHCKADADAFSKKTPNHHAI